MDRFVMGNYEYANINGADLVVIPNQPRLCKLLF